MGLEKEVMVAGRGILFPSDSDFFQGFRSITDCDYRKRIEREPSFIDPAKLGVDDKKIFSYAVFLNVDNKEIYAFSRGEDEKKIAVYIEGPVYPSDAHSRYDDFLQVLKNGAMREIHKQISAVDGVILDHCHGFINLEELDYRDRFGMLYFALVTSQSIRTQSRRTRVIPIGFAGKKSILQLESLCTEGELDSVSKVLLEPLKEYFNFL